eukprot:13888-Heterococcus_DN1.PRE.5
MRIAATVKTKAYKMIVGRLPNLSVHQPVVDDQFVYMCSERKRCKRVRYKYWSCKMLSGSEEKQQHNTLTENRVMQHRANLKQAQQGI